jgi:hypothetical protein
VVQVQRLTARVVVPLVPLQLPEQVQQQVLVKAQDQALVQPSRPVQ